MTIDFCVPVYNEDEIFPANAERIWHFLQSFMSEYDWRLVFVVNGSSQKFINLVQDFVDKNRPQSACFIISESGKGRAIKAYFDRSRADFLVYMDIDLAVDVRDLPNLLAPIIGNQTDICFGSRMLPSSVKNRSWFRELSSKAYLWLSRRLLGHHFTDLQCGFKAVSREAWMTVSPLILDTAWFFDTELICLAQRKSLRLQEVPVNWSENRYIKRRSKIKVWREAWVFLFQIYRLRRRLQKI
ncbi:MAG: glycosyltransferase [Patescibacteria group bacterium]|nr:glycosyltransferase [Patescibacteria group bacterium]